MKSIKFAIASLVMAASASSFAMSPASGEFSLVDQMPVAQSLKSRAEVAAEGQKAMKAGEIAFGEFAQVQASEGSVIVASAQYPDLYLN